MVGCKNSMSFWIWLLVDLIGTLRDNDGELGEYSMLLGKGMCMKKREEILYGGEDEEDMREVRGNRRNRMKMREQMGKIE